MTPRTLRFRALASVLVLALVALAGCSDDDTPQADPAPTTDSTSDGDEGQDDGNGEPSTGNPVTDGVVIEVRGRFDQTFRGGVCSIEEGMFQVVAGYKTGVGPNVPQGSPYANATVFLMGPAEDGEHETNFLLAGILESDDSVVIDEAPTVSIEPGFLSGTFESADFSGSFTCPAVLTAEQVNDLRSDFGDD